MAKNLNELVQAINECCEGEEANLVAQAILDMLVNVYNVYRAHGSELNLRESLQRFINAIDAQRMADAAHWAGIVQSEPTLNDDPPPPDRKLH